MVKLYANNIELDILDRTVNIFKEILDKDSISNRSSSWTREIELPNTSNNNEFFESIYKLDVRTLKFKKGKRVKAIMTDGANILLEGYMQLVNTKTSSTETTYNVIFAGQLIDLMSTLEDVSLTALDFSEYNHIRDWNTIKNSWSFDIQKNGDTINSREGYVYPDIVYTENGFDNDKYFFDYYPATNIKTIWDKILELTGTQYRSNFIDSNYFRSLYMPFSLKKLNEKTDKVKERTSIKSFDTNQAYPGQVMDNYYNAITTTQAPNTPTANGYWSQHLQNPYNLNFKNLTLFNDDTGKIGPANNETQLTDDLGQINSDIYICQKQGEYDIDINIPMIPKYHFAFTPDNTTLMEFDKGELEYRWIVFLKRDSGAVEILGRNEQSTNGNPLGLSKFSPSDNNGRDENDLPWYDTQTRLDIICSKTKFLNPGDKIYIQVHFKHTKTEWNNYNNGAPIDSDSVRCQLVTRRNIGASHLKFSVKPSSNQGYGKEEIRLSDTLPTMNCKDFLMSIIQTFNLVLDLAPDSTADNPIFIIEPYNEFFKHGKIVDDWVLDKNSELKQIYNNDIKKYHLSYTEDDDYYNDDYYNSLKPNKIYGEFNIYSNDDMASKTDELQLEFAPTINAINRTGNRVVPFLCDIEDEEFKAKKTKPRLVFYNGTLECDSYKVKSSPTFDLETLDEYPYVGMWDHPYDPINTLEFDYSQSTYYTPSDKLPLFTVFNKFHQNLRAKISEEYRLVEGYFYITSTQFSNFKFTDKIVIDNQLYRIILIDGYQYSEEETLTKVVLEKLVDYFYAPTDVTKSKGYSGSGSDTGSVCPTDIKLHHYSWGRRYESKTGVITKACCNERGGTWDNISKTCSIPFGSGTGPGTSGGITINPTQPVDVINPSGPIIGIIDDTTINKSPTLVTDNVDVVGNTIVNRDVSGTVKKPHLADYNNTSISTRLVDSQANRILPKTIKSDIYILDGTVDDNKNDGQNNDIYIIDRNNSNIV